MTDLDLILGLIPTYSIHLLNRLVAGELGWAAVCAVGVTDICFSSETDDKLDLIDLI